MAHALAGQDHAVLEGGVGVGAQGVGDDGLEALTVVRVDAVEDAAEVGLDLFGLVLQQLAHGLAHEGDVGHALLVGVELVEHAGQVQAQAVEQPGGIAVRDLLALARVDVLQHVQGLRAHGLAAVREPAPAAIGHAPAAVGTTFTPGLPLRESAVVWVHQVLPVPRAEARAQPGRDLGAGLAGPPIGIGQEPGSVQQLQNGQGGHQVGGGLRHFG